MELKDLKIELRPHVAKEKKVIGGAEVEVPVDFKQCYVLVNGKQVGWYCGRANEPNKYLSFIEAGMPQAAQDAIAAAVAKITGGVKSYNAPPPDDEHEVLDDGE